MGPLKNVKHEAFVQGLIQKKPAYQAYLDAGYACKENTAATQASLLLAKPNITERLLELSGKAADKVATKIALTKEWVVAEMMQAALDAAADKQHSPRIRAIELLGRETGNFTERKQLTVRSFAEMTAEEIEEFLAGQSDGTVAQKAGSSRTSRTGKKAKRGK
jgi:phage terminase small subunit